MDAKSPPPFLYQISVLHLRAGETNVPYIYYPKVYNLFGVRLMNKKGGWKLFEVVEASGASNWNLDLK